MLVLSRKRGEKIIVGTSDGQIEIMVTRIQSNGKVRLGINAPAGCDILRDELGAKQEATDGPATDGPISTVWGAVQ